MTVATQELRAKKATRVVLTLLTMLVAWTVIATAIAVLRGVAADYRSQVTSEAP